MSFALGVLRMTPDTFWSMSVSEWNAAVEGFQRARGIRPPLARDELEQMMKQHPDGR